MSFGNVFSEILHPFVICRHGMDVDGIGIPPDLIRLSVGLEDPDDLIADLKQALAKVK